jgi:hypothetical protein
MKRNGRRLMKRIHRRWALPASVTLALVPTSAWAHADAHPGGGFVAGLLHPISGLDHVVAMGAVGLWGTVLGPPALRRPPPTRTGLARSDITTGSRPSWCSTMPSHEARPPIGQQLALVPTFATVPYE